MRRVWALFIASLAALVVLSIVYLFAAAGSDAVEFADDGLEAAVREAVGEEAEFVTPAQLERMTELDASERGIERLDGIEQLPNLAVLDLRGNLVEDLSPLSQLERLRVLNLRENGIVDLAAAGVESLAGLPELQVLNLRHNRGPSHPERPDEHERISDLTALSALTGLVELDLRDNHIEDVAPLAELERLRRLDLRENRIHDDGVAPLAALRQLDHLNVRGNYLNDISPLSEITTLRYLNIHSNEAVESIVPLAGLAGLETLIMRGVPAGDEVQVLAELRELRRLNVRDAGIRDLTPIAELMRDGALQDRPEDGIHAEVDIRENPISESPEGSPAGYRVLADYWENVSRRFPRALPE